MSTNRLILPPSFRLSRYGINMRLATAEDSSFILSLRTNPKLGKYIHNTENDINVQKKWMEDYKQREKKGLDYYFIYDKDGVPFGVNRIYDIGEGKATGGSWICKDGTLPEESVATLLLMRDVMFEYLDIDFDIFDVRKGNRQVQKIHLMLGAKKTHESDLDYHYSLNKEEYFIQREILKSLLNLN